jgi:ABC-type anion transport system duplicated permease subunit
MNDGMLSGESVVTLCGCLLVAAIAIVFFILLWARRGACPPLEAVVFISIKLLAVIGAAVFFLGFLGMVKITWYGYAERLSACIPPAVGALYSIYSVVVSIKKQWLMPIRYQERKAISTEDRAQ